MIEIFRWESALARKEAGDRDYKQIVVKLGIPNHYLRKLEQLIEVKRIFSSRAEAFRRALELLFEKYEEVLRGN